jgi:hypothetical protein
MDGGKDTIETMTNQELREEFRKWYDKIPEDSKAIEPIVNAQRLAEEARRRINNLLDELGFMATEIRPLRDKFYRRTRVTKRKD